MKRRVAFVVQKDKAPHIVNQTPLNGLERGNPLLAGLGGFHGFRNSFFQVWFHTLFAVWPPHNPTLWSNATTSACVRAGESFQVLIKLSSGMAWRTLKRAIS